MICFTQTRMHAHVKHIPTHTHIHARTHTCTYRHTYSHMDAYMYTHASALYKDFLNWRITHFHGIP